MAGVTCDRAIARRGEWRGEAPMKRPLEPAVPWGRVTTFDGAESKSALVGVHRPLIPPIGAVAETAEVQARRWGLYATFWGGANDA